LAEAVGQCARPRRYARNELIVREHVAPPRPRQAGGKIGRRTVEHRDVAIEADLDAGEGCVHGKHR